MVGATVVGGGTPAFSVQPVPTLRLLDARRREDSDNVLLRYQVVGERAPSGLLDVDVERV